MEEFKHMEQASATEELTSYDTVMIPLSNGSEQEFAIMEEFDLNEKHYIVVSAVKEDVIQEGLYIYRAVESDGGLEISRIEDPEEFAHVTGWFESRA